MTRLRTLFGLSRSFELPTVWSNCLAGWWLGGGGQPSIGFLLVFVGATFLYLGGAFLNDAFDIEFDRRHRRHKAVPSGRMTLRTVWHMGLFWLAAGAVVLLGAGAVPGILGLLLACCVIGFNTVNRVMPFSSFLLGACRFLLYLLGASVALRGVTGWVLWSGLAMAFYVAGAGYFSRMEKSPGTATGFWPLILLIAPLFLAMIMNSGAYRPAALLLCGVMVLWLVRCFRQTLWASQASNGFRPSGFTTGIVMVDWLACANCPRELSFMFLSLALGSVLFEYAALLPVFRAPSPKGLRVES